MDEQPQVASQWQPKRRRRRRRRRVRRLALRLLILFFCAILWRHYHAPARPTPTPAQLPILNAPPAPLPDPPGIVLHASDTPGKSGGLPFNAARLEEIHAHDHPGWATLWQGKVYHIGYHFVILPNGTVETGRPVGCPGAHAIHHNDWIGICVIGAFSTVSNPSYHPSRPTPQQVAAVTNLCERLMSQYHIPPEMVKRHRDVRETWCPGSRFPYFAILHRLKAYAALHPETRERARLVAKSPSPAHPNLREAEDAKPASRVAGASWKP